MIYKDRFQPMNFTGRERRYKMFWITPELLLNCLFNMSFKQSVEEELVVSGIPSDCEVDAIMYSDERRAFGVRIFHQTFPIVEPGFLIPLVEVLVECRKQDQPMIVTEKSKD